MQSQRKRVVITFLAASNRSDETSTRGQRSELQSFLVRKLMQPCALSRRSGQDEVYWKIFKRLLCEMLKPAKMLGVFSPMFVAQAGLAIRIYLNLDERRY